MLILLNFFGNLLKVIILLNFNKMSLSLKNYSQ